MYRGSQHLKQRPRQQNEGDKDGTTSSSVADTTTTLSLASVTTAVVEAPPQRHALPSSNLPAHSRPHLTASQWHCLDDVVSEFVRETTNDEDVPPGLLKLLQSHQTPQRHSDQLAHPASTSSPGRYVTRSASQVASTLQSSIRPLRGLDSVSSRKAEAMSTAHSMPIAAKGHSDENDADADPDADENEEDDVALLLHEHKSDGSRATRPCWLAEAIAPGHLSCSAKEGEKASTTLHPVSNICSGGGGGGGDAIALSGILAVTAPANHCEQYSGPPCLFSNDAMPALGNLREATDLRRPTAAAIQPRNFPMTNVYENIRDVEGGGKATPATSAFGTSTTPSMRRQHAPPSAPGTAIVSSNPSPATFSGQSSKLCSPPDGALQVTDSVRIRSTNSNAIKVSTDRSIELTSGKPQFSQQTGQTNQRRLSTYNRNMDITGTSFTEAVTPGVGYGSSAIIIAGKAPHSVVTTTTTTTTRIPSPPPSMGSAAAWGAVASTSTRTTGTNAQLVLPPPQQQQALHLVEDQILKIRSDAPAPISVFRRLSGCAAANTMILSNPSSTDASYANIPHALVTPCGRLAATPAGAMKESCSTMGGGMTRGYRVPSGTSAPNRCSSATKLAESGATAMSLVDVTIAASVSDRPSFCGDTEPSLMAGVTWMGSLSSCAASATSPTAGTLTSTLHYGHSGVSNSMTT